MAKQVKFYSVATMPETPTEGALYFVNNGELYKGAQRFGLGRVTVADTTAGIADMKRGDIVVTGNGAGWVFDGTTWQSIGGDIASLQSSWRTDIKDWTAGLVFGGDGASYITGITQDSVGKVTIKTANFATEVKNAIEGSTATHTSNGITVSVTTTSGKVTEVSVTAPAAKTWTEVSVGDANSYIYHVE